MWPGVHFPALIIVIIGGVTVRCVFGGLVGLFVRWNVCFVGRIHAAVEWDLL